MRIQINNVHSVFAWSWDLRKSTDIPNDDTVVDKSHGTDLAYITNYEPKRHEGMNMNDEEESEEESDEDKDVCGICRANYNGACPSCKYPGDNCRLVIGKCLHNFHYHCIVKWISTMTSKGLCPMCRQEFKLDYNYKLNAYCEKSFEVLLEKLKNKRFLHEAYNNDEEEEEAMEGQDDDDDDSMDIDNNNNNGDTNMNDDNMNSYNQEEEAEEEEEEDEHYHEL